MAETVKDLRAKAKAAGIKGYSKMRKAQLEKALDALEGYDPADNSAGCYNVAIAHMRSKLESFRKEVIGDCTLYLGDCREILPLLPRFDAVVTDPPYGIGADKGNAHSSIRDNDAWDSFGWDVRPDADLLRRLGGAKECALWGGNFFADVLPASSGWLAWVKPQAGTGFSLADMELCWTNKAIAARTLRLPRRDGNEHPTQKPLQVMLWTLEWIASREILDPFMGSGTTGVACVKLGRKFTGIEREEKYFDIACRRIREAYRQPDMFVPAPTTPIEQLSLIAAE